MASTAPMKAGRPQPSPSQVPLGHLELAVLRRLDGLLQGDFAGLLPGHGSEIGEARPYAAGDDPRRIDWAVTARTGEPHVRDTVADHELELWVVVDASASLGFGTARTTKYDVAWAAAGAFALLAAKGGNRVAAVREGGQRAVFPPRSGRAHVGAVLTALRRAPQEGDQVDLAATLRAVQRNATRRGMVVVVSDFQGPAGWERTLAGLASRHDVIAVEVVDPRELDLPDVGLIQVQDPETGRRRYVDTAKAKTRDAYAKAAEARRQTVARSIAQAGADHLVLRTDRDWVIDLVRFVAGRRARWTAASRRSR